MTACERKNSEAVQMLLQYNADVNHRCNRGWTALHEAVARNDLEIIELLVQGGAKVESANCYGISSLFVAAESGHLEALRYLAKCGKYQMQEATTEPLLDRLWSAHHSFIFCLFFFIHPMISYWFCFKYI